MDLTKEQINRIESDCLATLRERGCVPDGKTLAIVSGSLGIRQLGKVDFLANLGYNIIWRAKR